MRRFWCVMLASVAGLAMAAPAAWAIPPDNLADAPAAANLGNGPSGAAFGENLSASSESGIGEPAHGAGGPFHSVWMQWTAPASPSVTRVSDCSGLTDFDTVVAVYSNTSASYTGLTPVASNDNGCPTGTGSRLSFQPTAGTKYFIAIDGATALDTGNYVMDLGPTPSNDIFANAAPLAATLPVSATGSNRYATKEVGEPTHHGDPGGVSVWWKWTSPVSPVDLTISTCGSDIATKLGVYTGSSVGALTPVSGTYAASCAQADVFRFTTDPSTTYRIAVDGLNTAIEEGGVETQAGQAIQLGLASKPVNDDLANASTLAGTLPSSTTGNNLAATKEVGEGNHAGQPGGTSVWYRWTAPSSGVTTVDTCGSPIDTLLDVYANAISYPVGAAIASNDDGCGGASAQSKLTFNAVASTTYLIAVDAAGAGGDFQLEIADKTAPSVTIDSAPTGTISDNTPTFTFHANEAGSTFECSLTTGSSNFLPCANPFTPASPLADGDYTFKVRAVDASVNTGAPLTRTFTVDTTGPTTTFHKTPPKKITIPRKQVKVRFGFKSEKNATFECKLDKAAYAACDSPVAYKVSWGRHHFKVRAKDTLGNLGPKIAYAFKVIHQT